MIEIQIDSLTECLVDRFGEKHNTYYDTIDMSPEYVNALHESGWTQNFDWEQVKTDGAIIIGLFAENDTRLQGLVGIEHRTKELYTYVPLVEAAPWNIGKNSLYKGVGGHLFAIAAKESFAVGNDGYIMFEAKTDLIEHYIQTLGAKIISEGPPARLYIDTDCSQILLNKYFKEDAT